MQLIVTYYKDGLDSQNVLIWLLVKIEQTLMLVSFLKQLLEET